MNKEDKIVFVTPSGDRATDIAANFQSAIAVVDMAVVNDKGQVLLGRKPGQDKFRFPGGFCGVEDSSYEEAAKRELREEVGSIELGPPQYIGSTKIADKRYANDKNKLYSAFYLFSYIFGAPKAGDDLEEVRWFDINSLVENDLVSEHSGLLQMFLDYLSKVGGGY